MFKRFKKILSKEIIPQKTEGLGQAFEISIEQSRIKQTNRVYPAITRGYDRGSFTPRAQQVIALARKEADRLNHNFLGTEHLLLGLIKLRMGVAVNVLEKMGLDFETVRMEVEKQVGPGPDQKIIGNIPYTPRVKKVLALASKESKALNHTYVGTEHILLGLIREGGGVAARILNNYNVDLDQTRQEILKELDPNFGVEENQLYLKPSRKTIDSIEEAEKRFRHHPLVQNYLHLIAAIKERKDRSIRSQSFDEAAEFRDKENQVRQKLQLLYDKLGKDPNYGIQKDEKLVQICRAIHWPTCTCLHPELARVVANHLLRRKPVILVAGDGASRMTLAGFVAIETFELSAQTNLIGTRLMRFDFSALDELAKVEGYATALLSVFDKMTDDNYHILVVPHLDYFATAELSSEDAINAWSQLIDTTRARRIPLLTWTDPDVGLPRIKSVWPGFVAVAAVIHVPEPDTAALQNLIETQLTTVSIGNQMEFENGTATSILAARGWWKQQCPLAEPGRTLALVAEFLKRLAEDQAGRCVNAASDAVAAEINSLQKKAVNAVSIGDFDQGEHYIQQIRLLKQIIVEPVAPHPKQVVTLLNVKQVLNQIHERQG